MPSSNQVNTEILKEFIFGRVEPQIYAFTTETIPNYLKVGDTYRPIEKRLNEWRKHFPNLEKTFQVAAKVDDDTFFRDFAVHKYLEKNIQKTRLLRDTISCIPYYSNEFFKDTTANDLDNAIIDIKSSYKKNNLSYKFYKSGIPVVHSYNRIDCYKPRPNQQETIDKFNKAIKNDRNNLLMYAVMRFGKSFTSMCCAIEMDAKIVVIVSAKADVKEEWKKTVESHMNFEEFLFIDSDSLLKNDTIIQDITQSNKKIALFLTLQDLQGDLIKDKHKELFKSKIDLLLIDETHFGARALEYGKVLKGFSSREKNSEIKLNDESLDELDKTTKTIKPKVRIHLSGTPYRILMDSEFTNEDIIAFYQFTNIAEDQENWNKKHLIEDDIKEWDNPYYGFPEMIRFAFNPNESSRKKMEYLKSIGISYSFSELFKPESILKDIKKNLHKKFLYEREVFDLLRVIDGSKKDSNILGFLDYDKLKDGKMCRHIVCVLPYRASCDAFEKLIKSSKFKNLGSYEVINISGVDNDKIYKDTQSVKDKISKCENEGKKTITLTVNRMLTGSTVPEWDTMLYLKDTASPQEYDQAIFRLQSQFIKIYKEPDGDIVKYNMKPQTLLVDFNPNRMFHIQEQKSQIYNVNVESNGNTKLEERIERELKISPIITMNNNKIVEVEPTDILDAVRKYSSERSVLDEAVSISIDYSLLDIEEIKLLIDRQAKIKSKQGLEIKPSEGEGDGIVVEGDSGTDEKKEPGTAKVSKTDEDLNYKEKFAMYYARMLFFAFLTESKIKSLNEIINIMDIDENNIRISSNLNLESKDLSLFQKNVNPFVLSELDYKIQNINSLANDSIVPPMIRASNAMKKFGRLSESEVVTPENITNRMMSLIALKDINESTLLIDIASKQGEFVYAAFKRFGKKVANNFYSIPTSKIAYEFTRKVYKLLELNLDNIEKDFISYDLIQDNNLIECEEIKINNYSMKFDVVVGNPPYQSSDGGGGLGSSAKPIYQDFVNIAKQLKPNYICMVMPTRWYAGGKGLDKFREQMLDDKNIVELHDFLKPELVFPNTNNRGGVCYVLWNSEYDNTEKLTKVFTYIGNLDNPEINTRKLKTEGSDILIRHTLAIEIVKKVKSINTFNSFENYVSSRKPFGFDSKFNRSPEFHQTQEGLSNPIVCYAKGRSVGYIDGNKFEFNKKRLDSYKVFTAFANNIGTELNDDNLNTFIGEPKSVCTETYIILGDKLEVDKISANNISKYFTTRFARFLHGIAKSNQNATSKTYKFVPLQNFEADSDIDWEKSIEEIEKQLYKKYKLNKKEVDFIEKTIKSM